eukprot:2322785-Amphidinium_carterae.1
MPCFEAFLLLELQKCLVLKEKRQPRGSLQSSSLPKRSRADRYHHVLQQNLKHVARKPRYNRDAVSRADQGIKAKPDCLQHPPPQPTSHVKMSQVLDDEKEKK